ncbi:hypothetical protein CHCC20344_3007 [Bacillus licheniformis]|nr:hypothetical protein CHCC20344_3007 [Bacillus licheniformis]
MANLKLFAQLCQFIAVKTRKDDSRKLHRIENAAFNLTKAGQLQLMLDKSKIKMNVMSDKTAVMKQLKNIFGNRRKWFFIFNHFIRNARQLLNKSGNRLIGIHIFGETFGYLSIFNHNRCNLNDSVAFFRRIPCRFHINDHISLIVHSMDTSISIPSTKV